MENNYNCKKKCQGCQFWSVDLNYSHKGICTNFSSEWLRKERNKNAICFPDGKDFTPLPIKNS